MTFDLSSLRGHREVLLAGLVVTVLVLAWLVRRIRRIAKSERPDEALSNLVMVVGLGWSSEAVWEITSRLDWPLSLRVLLFSVLESLLVLSMIRAKRAMRELGYPGRSGRTVWVIASAMSLVSIGAAHSVGEAVLRLVIPLLITMAWWDGLVGEGPARRQDATSWRWTPRRLLLAVGAIEPGERDVESVHRERLTQQMTRLEYLRRHGSTRLKDRRTARLARLSLTADDEITAEVRRRVDRASWFETTQPPVVNPVKPAAVAPVFLAPVSTSPVVDRDPWDYAEPIGPEPVSAPPLSVNVTDNVTDRKPAARRSPPSSRDRVTTAHERTPTVSNEELAARLKLSLKTIERHRPPRVSANVTDNEPAAVPVNGRVPDLESVAP